MSGLDAIIDKLASATVEDEREVTFAGKGLKLDTEEDALEIVEAIKNCSGMTKLCLEGNTIGIMAAKAIAKALESQPDFRKALWKDMFTRRTEFEIPEALNFLSSGIILADAHLVELDLSDNAFGPRGLKGIVNLLKSSPCYTLKELRLNNNGLGISGAKMLATALMSCLENSVRDGRKLCLRQFVCGRNRLENEGSVALSVFLKAVGTLEHIAMPQNGIYHVGIEALSQGFAANPGLKVLNLEDNSITAKGADHIAEVLPTLKCLEVINFGDCLLRTEGARTVARALKKSCPCLIELVLGYNEISKDGGIAVVDSLSNKKCLEKLVLNGNQFGSDGCQMVNEAMKLIEKTDALGSLSEDESSEEEEYDEEDDDEEEEEEDDDDENSEHEDCGKGDAEKEEEFSHKDSDPPTFTDFFSSASGSVLVRLHQLKKSILSELPADPAFNNYFNLFLKVSAAVTVESSDKVVKAAEHYTDEVLSAVFKACSEDEMWKFNNSFLVCLGLIKDEDKVVHVEDLTGALIVLKHAVENNYFHSSTRDLLKLILSRPLRYVKATHSTVPALMQVLYKL